MQEYRKRTVTAPNGEKYIYYYYKYHDIYGRRREITAKSIEILNKKRKKIEAQLASGVNLSEKTLADYCEIYLRTVHFNTVKEKTKERYLSILNNHLRRTPLGEMKMCDLTLDTVQSYYNTLSAINAKTLHKIVNPTLRYAGVKKEINFMIVPKIFTLPQEDSAEKQRKASRNTARPLSRAEHIAFKDAIVNHKYGCLFRTALDTGMRQGELFALTWADIDFQNRRITINKSGGITKGDQEKSRWIVGLPKNGQTRINRLPEVLHTILNEHRDKQKKELAKLGIIQTPQTLVFCTPLGTHLDSSNVLTALKKVYVSLGISSEKTFHDLRHTYATRQFEAGAEPLVISKLLGHSDLSVTLKTYIHILNSLKDATADKTDSFYASIAGETGENLAKNVIPMY